MSDSDSRDPFATGATPAATPAARLPATPRAMSVSTIRELFRIEARELLSGMGHRLAQLADQPDGTGLAEVAARGHALKGSAALAELPCLSRAGAVLQRAAELAAEAAARNHAAARDLVRATRAALDPAARMLDDCVDGSAESQDRLFAELLGAFAAGDRRELESRLASDAASEQSAPDYEERAAEVEPEVPWPGDDAMPAAQDSGVDADLAAMLAETFLLELTELLAEVPDTLLRMVDPSQQADLCADLGRVFHTVKGSAATVGRDDLRDLGKLLQDAFEGVGESPESLPLRPDFIASIEKPLGDVFLAAGLEPPAVALATLAQAAAASLSDEESAPPASSGALASSGARRAAGSAPLAAGSDERASDGEPPASAVEPTADEVLWGVLDATADAGTDAPEAGTDATATATTAADVEPPLAAAPSPASRRASAEARLLEAAGPAPEPAAPAPEPAAPAAEPAALAAEPAALAAEPAALAAEPAVRAAEPAAPAPAPAGDPTAAMIEREIMEAFLLDADAALDASEAALLVLERNPRDQQQLRILFRQFHTLKGAAAAVGLTRISEQLHAGETLLENIIEGAASHDPDALVDLLLELVDSVAGLIAETRGASHEHRILDDVAAHIDAVLARAAAPTPGAQAAAASSAASAEASPRPSAPQAASPPREAPPPASGDPESAIVRVHASRLDLLMNRVSELVVSRTRMEDTMGAIHELKDKLGFGKLRLHETIEGFRGFEFHPGAPAAEREAAAGDRPPSPLDFTDLEFDKYDDFNLLARTLVELADDASEIVQQLGGLIETMAEETRQVSKVTSSLQRTITGMRLLSLDTLFRRLQRPARDAARQVGKQIDLVCIGGEVQVDRALIESLYAPLLHLVRNAASHGLEPLVERRAAGKPDVGLIEIRAVQRHGSVDITLRDDGRGLDFGAIQKKAIATGLLEPGAAVTRDDLAALIFRPGFSTRSEVTDLAGRGIGMDVVAGEVEQLRGSVSVESEDGKGALFRIVLPLTAAIDQVLLLRAGSEVYALSHGPIDTVLNVDAEHMREEASGRKVRVGDDFVPAVCLSTLIGAPVREPARTAVVLRVAEQRMALLVDRIEAQREAVVRPLGRLFAGHPFITSATFSGDGAVIFVLDAGRLENWLAAGAAREVEHDGAGEPGEPRSRADAQPDDDADDATVLWADDSISVRRLAAHFLAAEGFTSRTAVDGQDALEKLRTGRFKVLVTDLEMPRMHGYELLHEIRSDPRLRDLPVIVCSSRSSEKHRRAARDAGANGYLTKPFTREGLAAALRELVGVAA